MTRANLFTQARIRRAVDAARKAGLEVTGFALGPDGSIIINGRDNTSHSTPRPLTAGDKPRDAREKLFAG